MYKKAEHSHLTGDVPPFCRYDEKKILINHLFLFILQNLCNINR